MNNDGSPDFIGYFKTTEYLLTKDDIQNVIINGLNSQITENEFYNIIN